MASTTTDESKAGKKRSPLWLGAIIVLSCGVAVLLFLYMSASSSNTTAQSELTTARESATTAKASLVAAQATLTTLQASLTAAQASLVTSQAAVTANALNTAATALCGTYSTSLDATQAMDYSVIQCFVAHDANATSLQLLINASGLAFSPSALTFATGLERTWTITLLGAAASVTINTTAGTLTIRSGAGADSAPDLVMYKLSSAIQDLIGLQGLYRASQSKNANTYRLIVGFDFVARTVTINQITIIAITNQSVTISNSGATSGSVSISTSTPTVSSFIIVNKVPWTFTLSSLNGSYTIPYTSGSTSGTLIWTPNKHTIAMKQTNPLVSAVTDNSYDYVLDAA
jgi:hypothetical protein